MLTVGVTTVMAVTAKELCGSITISATRIAMMLMMMMMSRRGMAIVMAEGEGEDEAARVLFG